MSNDHRHCVCHSSMQSAFLTTWQLAGMLSFGAVLQALIEAPCYGVPGICTYLAARSKWLDSEVAAAIAEGATQVVLLGAGYDTRAHRLAAAAPHVTVSSGLSYIREYLCTIFVA